MPKPISKLNPKTPPAKNKGGRPKGFDKELARLKLREAVFARMDALVDAQVSAAQGIKYLVWRDKASGKFKPVPEDALEKLNEQGEIIEVWEEKPSTPAFTDLMNRTLDKPTDQVAMEVTGRVDVVGTLEAARKRVADARKRR